VSIGLQSPKVVDGPNQDSVHFKPFQLVLHEAVASGLTEVLGSSGARAAFFHLKLTQAADAGKIHEGLVKIFGAGVKPLEFTILGDLFARIGSRFDPHESKTFVKFVAEAKSLYGKLNGGKARHE
jgi:hypothetical protein